MSVVEDSGLQVHDPASLGNIFPHYEVYNASKMSVTPYHMPHDTQSSIKRCFLVYLIILFRGITFRVIYVNK